MEEYILGVSTDYITHQTFFFDIFVYMSEPYGVAWFSG